MVVDTDEKEAETTKELGEMTLSEMRAELLARRGRRMMYLGRARATRSLCGDKYSAMLTLSLVRREDAEELARQYEARRVAWE